MLQRVGEAAAARPTAAPGSEGQPAGAGSPLAPSSAGGAAERAGVLERRELLAQALHRLEVGCNFAGLKLLRGQVVSLRVLNEPPHADQVFASSSCWHVLYLGPDSLLCTLSCRPSKPRTSSCGAWWRAIWPSPARRQGCCPPCSMRSSSSTARCLPAAASRRRCEGAARIGQQPAAGKRHTNPPHAKQH